MVQLAQVQLRSLSADGGLDFPPMSDVANPALYAAHIRHFRQLLHESVQGPFLPTNLYLTESSCLFSAPFEQAQNAFLPLEAVFVCADSDVHPATPAPPYGRGRYGFSSYKSLSRN